MWSLGARPSQRGSPPPRRSRLQGSPAAAPPVEAAPADAPAAGPAAVSTDSQLPVGTLYIHLREATAASVLPGSEVLRIYDLQASAASSTPTPSVTVAGVVQRLTSASLLLRNQLAHAICEEWRRDAALFNIARHQGLWYEPTIELSIAYRGRRGTVVTAAMAQHNPALVSARPRSRHVDLHVDLLFRGERHSSWDEAGVRHTMRRMLDINTRWAEFDSALFVQMLRGELAAEEVQRHHSPEDGTNWPSTLWDSHIQRHRPPEDGLPPRPARRPDDPRRKSRNDRSWH